jgi:ABC-type sulfate transport system substrate-binding protein
VVSLFWMEEQTDLLRINYYPVVCREDKPSGKFTARSSHAVSSFHATSQFHIIHGGESSSNSFNNVFIFNSEGINMIETKSNEIDESFTEMEAKHSPFISQHTITMKKGNQS